MPAFLKSRVFWLIAVAVLLLGGGGMVSLRNDALGKGMAQMLLDLPVSVPENLLLLLQS